MVSLRTPQASRADLRQYEILLVPVVPRTACLSRMIASKGGVSTNRGKNEAVSDATSGTTRGRIYIKTWKLF